jgi:hypothetical protein
MLCRVDSEDMSAEDIARATGCDAEIVDEEFRAAAYLAGIRDEP